MKKEEYEKNPDSLQKLANEAILQIQEKEYDCELTGDIIHIGLAHAGTPNGGQCQDVEMIWKDVGL